MNFGPETPSGTYILALSPARAAYAAIEAPALPDESSETWPLALRICLCRAEMRVVEPRSLKEPVGLRFSSLK